VNLLAIEVAGYEIYSSSSLPLKPPAQARSNLGPSISYLFPLTAHKPQLAFTATRGSKSAKKEERTERKKEKNQHSITILCFEGELSISKFEKNSPTAHC